jgi:hypothetical protein
MVPRVQIQYAFGVTGSFSSRCQFFIVHLCVDEFCLVFIYFLFIYLFIPLFLYSFIPLFICLFVYFYSKLYLSWLAL